MLWLYLTVLLDRALELYRFRDGDDAFKSNLLLFHSIQKVEVWTLITKEGKEHFSRGGSNLFIGKRFGTICFTCWKGHNYSKHTTGCFYVCGTLFFFALIKTLLTQDVLNLCSVADIMSCNRGFSGTPLERWIMSCLMCPWDVSLEIMVWKSQFSRSRGDPSERPWLHLSTP